MSAIATLVRRLADAGATAEAIAIAVEAVEALTQRACIVCHPARTDGTNEADFSPASLRRWPRNGEDCWIPARCIAGERGEFDERHR